MLYTVYTQYYHLKEAPCSWSKPMPACCLKVRKKTYNFLFCWCNGVLLVTSFTVYIQHYHLKGALSCWSKPMPAALRWGKTPIKVFTYKGEILQSVLELPYLWSFDIPSYILHIRNVMTLRRLPVVGQIPCLPATLRWGRTPLFFCSAPWFVACQKFYCISSLRRLPVVGQNPCLLP